MQNQANQVRAIRRGVNHFKKNSDSCLWVLQGQSDLTLRFAICNNVLADTFTASAGKHFIASASIAPAKFIRADLGINQYVAAGSLFVQSVDVLSGQIEDLFDWDYDVTLKAVPLSSTPYYGSMAKAGAMLQAAYGGVGGTGGLVFQNVYQLGNKTLPGFSVEVGP
jgi:hypothetical protein